MSYTKLASSILTSTIWMEHDHTRLVWLALLAMADKNGEVQASIPGLANIARVPVESCRTAIALLMGPDPDSRSQIDEGRRLQAIKGGWVLVNYGDYRRLASDEDRKEKAAIRARRCYEKSKRNEKPHAILTPPSRQNSQAEAEAKAKAENEFEAKREGGPGETATTTTTENQICGENNGQGHIDTSQALSSLSVAPVEPQSLFDAKSDAAFAQKPPPRKTKPRKAPAKKPEEEAALTACLTSLSDAMGTARKGFTEVERREARKLAAEGLMTPEIVASVVAWYPAGRAAKRRTPDRLLWLMKDWGDVVDKARYATLPAEDPYAGDVF